MFEMEKLEKMIIEIFLYRKLNVSKVTFKIMLRKLSVIKLTSHKFTLNPAIVNKFYISLWQMLAYKLSKLVETKKL
jgi:hypothetical protein